MCKVLVIDKATERSGVNEIGDVVGIFEDDHVFSAGEKSGFKIVQMPGVTKKQGDAFLNSLIPETQEDPDGTTWPKYQWKLKNTDQAQLAGNVTCKIASA